MGQINVSADAGLIADIDRVAAAMGKTRPELLRQAMQELVEAHDGGRLAFAREEGPKLDASLSHLAGRLHESIIEIDRAQTQNAKIAKRLIDAWNGGEQAVLAAQERISKLVNEHLREGYQPYRTELNDVFATVQALPDKLAAALRDQLAAIDQKLADNRKLARQPRTASYYSLSDSWHINASVLATIGAALFVIGCFCGSVLWRAPELPSKDPVLAIVPTPASACRVVNYVFRAKDCRIPERDRQHAVDALRQEKQP